MRVTLLGTGIMGAAMARNLVRNVFGAYAATPGYNRCFEWIGFAEAFAALAGATGRVLAALR